MGDRSVSSGRTHVDELTSQLDIANRVTAFVCARNRLSADEADDFASHVTVKLLEDDQAILRKFAGRSSIRTYLTVVIQRLFLDYRIAAWGKWRPSAEARRQGEVGILVERLLTRDGYTVEEAFELLTTNHRVAISRAELDTLLERLPLRVKRRFEGEDALMLVSDSQPNPEDALAGQAHEESSARVAALLKRAIAAFPLEDQLLLTMRYEDGRTVAEIGAAMRLEQKSLYRRFERLLKELRSKLESEGVGAREVSEMLDAQVFHRDVTEEREARPSVATGART